MDIKADFKVDPAIIYFDISSFTNVADLEQIKQQVINPRFKAIPNYIFKSVKGNKIYEQEVEFDFYIASKVGYTNINGYFYVRIDILL